MKLFANVVAVLAALAVAPGALAHAFLDRASPAVGSTVHGPPKEVRLWFTQPLEPTFCALRVFDASGKQVDRQERLVKSDDGTVLRVSLPKLGPGTYRVVWRALSVDAHVTEGDYTFEIAP